MEKGIGKQVYRRRPIYGFRKRRRKTVSSKACSIAYYCRCGTNHLVYSAPSGLEPKAWHLFAIFVATIIGFISKPLPMGAIAIFALAVTALTGTLSIEDTLSGFGNKTIWLIVIAFFISRGFIKTGLGARISYVFVQKFGKKPLDFLIHCYSVI